METKYLAAFKTVYETESITEAAKRLYISHQGLSKAIDNLENDLGVRLFERTNRGVRPTEAARVLYPKAVRVVDLIDSIRNDATSGHRGETLSVACTSGGLTYNLTSFKRDFQTVHPDVDLRFEEGHDRRVAELVERGITECGFVAGPVNHALFEGRLVARHPHVLVIGEGDPLASKERVSFADIHRRRLALIGAGFAPFDYIQDRLEREGVRPREIIGVSEIQTGSRLASDEDVLAITADFTVLPDPLPGTVVRPFEDAQFTWDISFITRRDAGTGPHVARLRDFAHDWCAAVARERYIWRADWDKGRG